MSELVNNVQNAAAHEANENEFRLLERLIVLARYKRLLIGVPLVAGVLALALGALLPAAYTSITRIMPPQPQQSAGVAAMLGQLGGLAGAAGGLGGLKNPNDLYIGMLSSRTLADSLIVRFKLKERYKRKTMDDTRRALADRSEIVTGKKDGLIGVSVTDKEPQFAADLANAYAQELVKLTQGLAITEAQQRRMFYEKQLLGAKEQLTEAEIALRQTQESTGMIQPGAQVGAIIANVAQLKGRVAAKEVQLSAMQSFATGRNPEYMLVQQELSGLRAQLSKAERNQGSASSDFMVPTGTIPKIGVEYVRSVRNVKYHETIYELLAKQFELAKIDEAKESTAIQVLDKAVPAERESKPMRLKLFLAAVFGGFLLAVVLAFVHAAYRSARADADNAQRLAQLAQTWKRPTR